MSDFKKRQDGVVINSNKSALNSAKKRKKLLEMKNAKITDLENRLLLVEEFIAKQQKG